MHQKQDPFVAICIISVIVIVVASEDLACLLYSLMNVNFVEKGSFLFLIKRD